MLTLSFGWLAAHQAGSLVSDSKPPSTHWAGERMKGSFWRVSVCLIQVGEAGSYQDYCLGIRAL